MTGNIEGKRKLKGWWVLPAILVIAVVIYFSRGFSPTRLSVDISRQQIVKSNYDFIFEHWKEEKLFQLIEAEDYRDLKAANQFEYFLMLCTWVHNQWERSLPDPYPLSNAVDILRDIRSGKTGGFCGQYTYVLADVLKSLGYFAVRYVELWSKDRESHFVVEVWSDWYEKWIVLDADHNIYYEILESKIPANAYEVHQALFRKVKITARSVENPHTDLGDKKIHLYANFAVSLRSDLMRHTKPLTVQDRFQMFLFFKDEHTGSQLFDRGIPYLHVSSRIEDFYFDCNCARASYSVSSDKRSVKIELFTDNSMPNFKCFALSKDTGKTWQQFNGSTFVIQKKKGKDYLLWAAPVNMYERLGCLTRIKIQF